MGLSYATVTFVFLWQPEVYISMNLCPLPRRLLLLVQISVSSKKKLSVKDYLSSSAAECFLMEEEKIHHGACAALAVLSCSFLDWTKGLMEWACQAKEVSQELVTGSARHVPSLIALYHMQIGALTLKISPRPFNSIEVAWSTGCLWKCGGEKEQRADTGFLLILSAWLWPSHLFLVARHSNSGSWITFLQLCQCLLVLTQSRQCFFYFLTCCS